jgi:hypothetical protein
MVFVFTFFFLSQEAFTLDSFYVPAESTDSDKVDFELIITTGELETMVDNTTSAMVEEAKRAVINVCIIHTKYPGF